MKHIGNFVGKALKQTDEKPEEKSFALTKLEKVWFDQINYHALMKGLKPPEKEEAIIKAKGFAKSLSYVTPACIAACWEHSRKHDNWVDEKSLSNAWENVVKHNYYYDKQRKQSSMARIERSQPMSKVEHEKAMKRAWEVVDSECGFVPEWARNKYLTKEK